MHSNEGLVSSGHGLPDDRPRTADQLHQWIKEVLGFGVPRAALVPGHDAPFDYILHAFFEDRHVERRDCVVWANRGGGKTQLGAIATLLDMVFKPGIQVRILGGSLDQSSKMHQYLKAMLETDALAGLIDGNITGRAVRLTNGSRVEVLSQSERAVRGQRVHRLRCDEVELFTDDVWRAAQLVTRSGTCGDVHVRASIECLSTMHRSFGLMQQLVGRAERQGRSVFKWGMLDTLERCGPERACEGCPLWDDCRGKAKEATGFLHIDDAIRQRRRIGIHTWRAEMLCEHPARAHNVYPEFDVAAHVEERDPPDGVLWLGGIDFGYRAPTAMVWAYLDMGDVLHVVDEFVQRHRTAEQVIEMAHARRWPDLAWIGADPAGYQRSDQTGVNTITIWRRAGFTIKARATQIREGVDAVRARLRRADGTIALMIHARCRRLIEALQEYHYPPDEERSETPVKDGHDHIADALRYLVVNLDRGAWTVRTRGY